MHLDLNSCRIELICGDITDQEIDAIVNAANASLAGGCGVDGAIHRRGGSAIMQETKEKYPMGCPTGSAVVSGAGNLKAKFVFHAVGPRWRGGTANEPELLRSAYRTCLELVAKHGCQSIAFPSISPAFMAIPFSKPLRWQFRRLSSLSEKHRNRSDWYGSVSFPMPIWRNTPRHWRMPTHHC